MQHIIEQLEEFEKLITEKSTLENNLPAKARGALWNFIHTNEECKSLLRNLAFSNFCEMSILMKILVGKKENPVHLGLEGYDDPFHKEKINFYSSAKKIVSKNHNDFNSYDLDYNFFKEYKNYKKNKIFNLEKDAFFSHLELTFYFYKSEHIYKNIKFPTGSEHLEFNRIDLGANFNPNLISITRWLKKQLQKGGHIEMLLQRYKTYAEHYTDEEIRKSLENESQKEKILQNHAAKFMFEQGFDPVRELHTPVGPVDFNLGEVFIEAKQYSGSGNFPQIGKNLNQLRLYMNMHNRQEGYLLIFNLKDDKQLSLNDLPRTAFGFPFLSYDGKKYVFLVIELGSGNKSASTGKKPDVIDIKKKELIRIIEEKPQSE